MTFSKEWNIRYSENTHLSVWPWSEVVSLVHRHCKPIIAGGGGQVLEMGCGAGANIPLFRVLGLDYKAIEGSHTIVEQLHERYPDMTRQIVCGDFTVEQPFGEAFDLVLDRAALAHNNTKSIRRALKLAFESLKNGGLFIGVDWFSINHSDAELGHSVEDANTRTNYTNGQFAGIGKVHFSDETHLRDLFKDFEIIYLEEKLVRRYEPKDDCQLASWNIVAKKPNA